MDQLETKPLSLDDIYGIDAAKDKEGVWFNVGAAKFKCRYWDLTSIEAVKAMREVSKPFRKLIDAKMISPEQDRKLGVTCFVKVALITWEGVSFNGQENVPYSEEAAIDLFTTYSRLFVDLSNDASELAMFRAIGDGVKN